MRTTRAVRGLAATGLLAALLQPTLAHATPAPWKRVRYEMRLNSKTDATIWYTITVRTDDRPGYVAKVDTGSSSYGPYVFPFLVADIGGKGHGNLRTWGETLGSRDVCQAPADCGISSDGRAYTYSGWLWAGGDGEERRNDRFFIVAEGTYVSVKVTKFTKGWSVLPPHVGGFSRLTVDQMNANGVDVDRKGYEVNLGGGSLAGGKNGSAVVYNPGCPDDGSGGPSAGESVIFGGEQPDRVPCPWGLEGVLASAATTWQVMGPIVTQTNSRTRLVEVDL